MKREGVTAPFQEVMPNGNVYWFDAQGVLFKKVYPRGEIEWCDEQEQPHREDGPALEWPDGTRCWLRHGREHREDGPAVETPDFKQWYRNGELHRDDGPAIEYSDGRQDWWRNGRRLKPEKIKAIMEKNAAKIAEPFMTGLDHPIQVWRAKPPKKHS